MCEITTCKVKKDDRKAILCCDACGTDSGIYLVLDERCEDEVFFNENFRPMWDEDGGCYCNTKARRWAVREGLHNLIDLYITPATRRRSTCLTCERPLSVDTIGIYCPSCLLRWGLERCAYSTQGFKEKFGELAGKPISDSELKNILSNAFGIEGGGCGPGTPWFDYHGGAQPWFSVYERGDAGSSSVTRCEKVKVAGKELLELARTVWNLPKNVAGPQTAMDFS